jgi:hypothetical protein
MKQKLMKIKMISKAFKSNAHSLNALIVICLIAGIGAYMLQSSHASTPYASINADQGKLTSPAISEASSAASDGQYVEFGNVSAVTNSTTPVIVGKTLEAGDTGKRLQMKGVAVWGIQDEITSSFGASEYTQRQTIINTIKSWGANVIRFRLLASDYNSQTYMTQLQEIQEIKDWQSAAQAAGVYFQVTWWDSLDGAYNDANWANDYSQVFPMMTAVINALGATNPWVIYEPFNEPNNVDANSWLSAMIATEKEFRNNGYKGILILDTYDWSHAYNDSDMTTLENDDAGLSGMNGKDQIIFAKHDYANEGFSDPDSNFDSSYWAENSDGTGTWDFTKHLVWETEFGNYNGSSSTEHLAWSAGAATWMNQQVSNGTLVGAEAFLFGPWYDANAMTASDNVTPTQWGGYVKDNFLN